MIHNMAGTHFYNVWVKIKGSKKDIPEEWFSFSKFKEDTWHGYEQGMTFKKKFLHRKIGKDNYVWEKRKNYYRYNPDDKSA